MDFIPDEHVEKEKKHPPVELGCGIEDSLPRPETAYFSLPLPPPLRGAWGVLTDVDRDGVVQPTRGRSRCGNPDAAEVCGKASQIWGGSRSTIIIFIM